MQLTGVTLNFFDEKQGRCWTISINEEWIWASKQIIPVEVADMAKNIAAHIGWQPCVCQPQGEEDEPCEDYSCARR